MDYELKRMMTSEVTFKLRANSAYGPGTAVTVGPVSAYVEESKRTRSKQGEMKQGQVVFETGVVIFDPEDDAILSQVFAAEVAEIVLPGGTSHRIESVSTLRDPESGEVDHYEISY